MRFSNVIWLLLLLMLSMQTVVSAQIISGTGCAGLTNYTNSNPNDSIFYYPAGQLGSLTATPPGGVPGWTFTWSSYNASTAQWSQVSVQTNVPTSTINNLNPGLYSVSVVDGTGAVIGCDYAWISQITTPPSVNVLPIAPACNGPISLQGVITNPVVTPHSNLPNIPMFITPSTQITVCFTGTHTWVSDLAFYLRGPASCGSPNILLSPNPGAIGQGAICNSGDNFTNLCFTRTGGGNLNVCSPAPATLSGTYSSYGPGFTPINWTALNGCEATAPGWAVQVYDCIGGDVGALTSATITFTGTNVCGAPQTVTYATPSGFFSGIADNSCSSTAASIFQVPAASAPPPIQCTYGYVWTSNPPVFIPNATSSLNISLPQLEQPQGNPIPWQDVVFTLSLTSNCNGLGFTPANGVGCLGGNSQDSELFQYTPLNPAVINPVPDLCEFDLPVQLQVNVPGGVWSGTGVNASGLFTPTVAGIGSHVITYSTGNPCIPTATITINVIQVPQAVITPPAPVCVDQSPVQLQANLPGGMWSGPGIVDPMLGLFDPAVAGVGVHIINFSVGGYCPTGGSTQITVNALPTVTVTPSQAVCSNATTQLQASGASSYVWHPTTALSNPNIANPTSQASSDITYTVTGTDGNGCSNTAQTTLTMIPLPTVTAQPVAEICPGTQVNLVATAGPGAFSWSPSAGVQNANTANATASPLVTTTYTVTYTDGCGLQATTQVPVAVDLPLVVNAGADTQFCTGSTVTLNATAQGNTVAQMQWTTTTGTVNPGSANSPQLVVDDAGIYFYNATTPLGCVYSDAVGVIEVPLPVLNLTTPVDLCPNGNVTLNSGIGWDAVQWSNGQTTPAIVVSSAGTYQVTVTEQGCSSSGSVIVNQVVLPYVELGTDVGLCSGSTLTLDIGTPGNWSTGAVAPSINITTAGTYHVTVVVGPCSVSDTIRVTLLPLPAVQLGFDITGCVDEPEVLNAFNSVNTGYLWNTGETTPQIEVSEDGIYTVEVSNGCGTTQDQILVVFEDCTYQLYFPNAFTPDNDGINDVWRYSTFNLKKFEMFIFNRWGDVVFTSNELEGVWVGDVHDGEHYAGNGVYFYRVKFESNTGDVGIRSGHITVIR